MTTAQDHHFMGRAMQLARSSLYSPHPNPRVGCVITQQSEIIGEGRHAYPGGPHAEVNALSRASRSTRGATAYVTLEPCSHHGRTPPCVDALLDAGIARVVVAMQDPNPLVSGRGIQGLIDAGVEVSVGVLADEAEKLNRGFIKRMRHGRPYVRAKLAMSLDGRTAMSSGESQWITGTAARADVQRLRASSSTILSGIGTVLADDPSLTVRAKESNLEIAPAQIGQPLRVVVDSRLRMPPSAKLLQQAGNTLIFSSHHHAEKIAELNAAGAEVVVLDGEQPALDAVLEALAARAVNEVLVEAGSTLNGALLAQGLIDEIVIYMAPCLMGDGAKGLFHLPELRAMREKVALEISDIRAVGNDWRISANVVDVLGASSR